MQQAGVSTVPSSTEAPLLDMCACWTVRAACTLQVPSAAQALHGPQCQTDAVRPSPLSACRSSDRLTVQSTVSRPYLLARLARGLPTTQVQGLHAQAWVMGPGVDDLSTGGVHVLHIILLCESLLLTASAMDPGAS